MDTTMGGVTGDWGPDAWYDSGGTTANNGPEVHTNSVIEGSTSTQGSDRWSGWFQGIVDKGLSYAVQRDAARSGLVQQRAANGQPVYTAQQPALQSVGGITSAGMLLIGGAALVGVLLVVASKKG